MQTKLEKEGYFVIRAAGSHGVADLVAVKFESVNGFVHEDIYDVLFVSCKIPMYAPPAERLALVEAAERCGAKAVMTVKDKAGKWILQTVDS